MYLGRYRFSYRQNTPTQLRNSPLQFFFMSHQSQPSTHPSGRILKLTEFAVFSRFPITSLPKYLAETYHET
jgi:hypothetical protein